MMPQLPNVHLGTTAPVDRIHLLPQSTCVSGATSVWRDPKLPPSARMERTNTMKERTTVTSVLPDTIVMLYQV